MLDTAAYGIVDIFQRFRLASALRNDIKVSLSRVNNSEWRITPMQPNSRTFLRGGVARSSSGAVAL